MLAVKDFDAAYTQKLPDIRKDVADGRAPTSATPTYFINGIRAVGAGEARFPALFRLALSTVRRSSDEVHDRTTRGWRSDHRRLPRPR
jgi:hypothetical protein